MKERLNKVWSTELLVIMYRCTQKAEGTAILDLFVGFTAWCFIKRNFLGAHRYKTEKKLV